LNLITPQFITDWYRDNSDTYLKLGSVVESTLTSLLGAQKVSHLSVSYRLKSLPSLLRKVESKNYSKIDQITDCLGVRIILFLDSDVERTNSIVSDAFEVDKVRSINKSDELDENKIGYRSTHHICSMGPDRLVLPELSPYAGISFEVQVRTVLQHAWAEIEHDRIYKFSGDLPKSFRRRINLLSGTLELIDREFSNLSREIDETQSALIFDPHHSVADEDEITSQTFLELIKSEPKLDVEIIGSMPISAALDEVEAFGINNIGEIKNLLTDEFIAAANVHERKTTLIGLLRSLMMFHDLDAYFSKAWRNSWGGIEDQGLNLLSEKYGRDHVLDWINRLSIDLQDEDWILEID